MEFTESASLLQSERLLECLVVLHNNSCYSGDNTQQVFCRCTGIYDKVKRVEPPLQSATFYMSGHFSAV